jgi:hypothetical protein
MRDRPPGGLSGLHALVWDVVEQYGSNVDEPRIKDLLHETKVTRTLLGARVWRGFFDSRIFC